MPINCCCGCCFLCCWWLRRRWQNEYRNYSFYFHWLKPCHVGFILPNQQLKLRYKMSWLLSISDEIKLENQQNNVYYCFHLFDLLKKYIWLIIDKIMSHTLCLYKMFEYFFHNFLMNKQDILHCSYGEINPIWPRSNTLVFCYYLYVFTLWVRACTVSWKTAPHVSTWSTNWLRKIKFLSHLDASGAAVLRTQGISDMHYHI